MPFNINKSMLMPISTPSLLLLHEQGERSKHLVHLRLIRLDKLPLNPLFLCYIIILHITLTSSVPLVHNYRRPVVYLALFFNLCYMFWTINHSRVLNSNTQPPLLLYNVCTITWTSHHCLQCITECIPDADLLMGHLLWSFYLLYSADTFIQNDFH